MRAAKGNFHQSACNTKLKSFGGTLKLARVSHTSADCLSSMQHDIALEHRTLNGQLPMDKEMVPRPPSLSVIFPPNQ